MSSTITQRWQQITAAAILKNLFSLCQTCRAVWCWFCPWWVCSSLRLWLSSASSLPVRWCQLWFGESFFLWSFNAGKISDTKRKVFKKLKTFLNQIFYSGLFSWVTLLCRNGLLWLWSHKAQNINDVNMKIIWFSFSSSPLPLPQWWLPGPGLVIWLCGHGCVVPDGAPE